MSVTITCDIFSGKRNPSWELSVGDAIKLEKLLEKNRSIYFGALPFNFVRLGYKGFILHSQREAKLPKVMRVFDGILDTASVYMPGHIDHNSEVESFLCGTANSALTPDEKKYIYQEIKKNLDNENGKNGRLARLTEAQNIYQDMALEYDPDYWNGEDHISGNNCYNYATDKRTNSFAIPGDGRGRPYREPATCHSVKDGVIRDGLRPIEDYHSTYMPKKGYVIALYVRDREQREDFHFYRRDKGGSWSHKPGSSPATNLDNDNKVIHNPELCDRGEYNSLCGYFNCIPDEIQIG